MMLVDHDLARLLQLSHLGEQVKSKVLLIVMHLVVALYQDAAVEEGQVGEYELR